jgi:hypothetical protein
MLRRTLLLLVLSASLARTEVPPPLLSAVEELIKQVAPENTTYKHKEPEVLWSADPKNPAYCHTDCSGLLIALLGHTYPQRYDEAAFKRWLDSRRPTARRFYDAIDAQRGFKKIEKITDARPGDVIALKYQPGGDNTGHIMMISEPARRADSTVPVVEGTEQWLVPIIDETASGHGPTDTRRTPEGKFRGGLGKGIFRVYTKPDGTLTGYAWSTFRESKYYGGEERVIAIGRFDPDFKP